MSEGFRPPPYPYERLDGLKALADAHDGGLVDLSIGTPCDPPAEAVRGALAASDSERGYPPSIGSPALREAACDWMARRLGVQVPAGAVAACVGRRSSSATLPSWLRLRTPDRDTVLHPAVAYPTYEMGATLAGCRPVAVAVDDQWRLRLDSIAAADAERGALSLGQLTRQPEWFDRRPRCRRRVGEGARRAGLQRRVLRRVHLGRTSAHDPRARAGGPRRCSFAVEALQPGGLACRLLRGRPRAGALPHGGSKARRHDGAGAGAGRGHGGAGRRRSRRRATGALPRSHSTS